MIARNKTGRRHPCAQNSQTQATLGRIQVGNPGPYRAIPHDWAFWSDTPPSAHAFIADVIARADLVVVPVRPTPDDLDAVGPTLDMVEAAGKNFVFVVSQA